ncbi:MAG: hypothetical protein IH587_06985 [Anaerolineae bacterium]|nr:hypothetical protein [Anaerolineae bacterium]
MLPQPFTGRGSFAYTGEAAIQVYLSVLYRGTPLLHDTVHDSERSEASDE